VRSFRRLSHRPSGQNPGSISFSPVKRPAVTEGEAGRALVVEAE
jgi:hypothetical protein